MRGNSSYIATTGRLWRRRSPTSTLLPSLLCSWAVTGSSPSRDWPMCKWHTLKLWSQAHILNNIENNNITSVGVIRKAAWPCLSQLYIVNNQFGDANSLVHGCFSHMQILFVYNASGDEKNGFREQCFAAKMQADSLKYLQIQANKFCFNRCLKRVLRKRWPNLVIH